MNIFYTFSQVGGGTMPAEVLSGLYLAVFLIVAFLVFYIFLRSLLYICPPNEALIFSGRRHKQPDGSIRGFRVVFGGRGWRVPILERVDRMNLNTFEVPISIRGAYSQGGIALNVEAVANVKVSSNSAVMGNAIERFLGQPPTAIGKVSKETLEGHLRGVLARLTPEQINEDRLKFAEELSNESELDLKKLGLHLDTFKIQHVSDESHYLDSIGREAIANIIRDAEIAESDAKRQAEKIESEELAKAKVAEATADAAIAKMRNELRTIQADLEAKVTAEQETTKAAAREARAKAEQELQQIRSQVEALRLKVDEILPAEAEKVAREYSAKGDAASVRERGLAAGQALEALHSAWRDAGPAAMNIAVMDDLEKILKATTDTVKKVKIGTVKLVDSGDGQALTNYVASYPAIFHAILASVRDTVGIDVPQILHGTAPDSNSGEPETPSERKSKEVKK
ncbi:MAG: flotillin family protein [Armatimonadetes bacterium]|nr:flotillin family protein [Armatimonadota bacterium]MBS1703285.1 flotillin family protein [Armatimonadota bacterium]